MLILLEARIERGVSYALRPTTWALRPLDALILLILCLATRHAGIDNDMIDRISLCLAVMLTRAA